MNIDFVRNLLEGPHYGGLSRQELRKYVLPKLTDDLRYALLDAYRRTESFSPSLKERSFSQLRRSIALTVNGSPLTVPRLITLAELIDRDEQRLIRRYG